MSESHGSARPAAGAPAGRDRNVEHTRWSPGLIGFYLSCAGVALGATFAASGHFFFGSSGWLVFGAVMSGVSCITCYISLRAARKAPSN
ncbi:MAG: hypothetical protein RL398_2325 [Planctomycetota bacterium]|jgi:hypothetical protein